MLHRYREESDVGRLSNRGTQLSDNKYYQFVNKLNVLYSRFPHISQI